MKKIEHPIDNLFREALDGHKMAPSNAARKAFLKDAAALPPAKNKRRGGLILFSALILMSIFGFVAWQFTTEKEPSKPAPKVAVSRNHNQTLPIKNDIKQNLKPQETVKYKSSQPSQPQEKNIEASAIIKHIDQEPQPELNSPLEYQAIQELPEDKPTLSEEAANPPMTATAIEAPAMTMSRENITDTVKTSALNPDSTIVPEVPKEKSGIKHKVPAGKFRSSIGVFYTPELMFNTLEGEKFVNNFGVEGIFNDGPFSIRTGAGLSIAKGTNELTVEYNDFLGAYNKLDSMDFTWNDPTHQYLPTFYMTRQDVWDSLLKLDYPKVIKRYTYLQIPLIFGYDFWNNENFSIGFRIGPLLSVLLDSKQLSAEYDPGKNKVIRINDISPGQVSLNWQVMAGLNASVRLSESFKFEIEPCARYYFNSVYEKPVNNAKPWSIGVRAAFIIQF